MAKSSKESSVLTDRLYDKVNTSLTNKDVLKEYKDNLGKHLSRTSDIYFAAAPGERPIYTTQQQNDYIALLGLTNKDISQAVKDSKDIKNGWFMAKPYNMANAMATRFFCLSKNTEYQQISVGYLIFLLYPLLHTRYFKYGTVEACMDYTINNMSDKYGLKKSDNLWSFLMGMGMAAIELHGDRLADGTDISYINYVQDVQTRLNNALRNISNLYYDNHRDQKYLIKDKESYDEDNYHEADSNTYSIDTITNRILSHLLLYGADMKLVELAAKTNTVSVAEMRNFATTIINDAHVDGIRKVIESILFLYLFVDDKNVNHKAEDINTNDFTVYCLQMYKRSNTTNPNIVRIKEILDGWLVECKIVKKSTALTNFRKALFAFFVFEIQQNA